MCQLKLKFLTQIEFKWGATFKTHPLWSVFSIVFGAYRECGILAGGRAKRKQLIVVFAEAMSHVASRTRRVYRAEVMRHKSGRGEVVRQTSTGMRCADCLFSIVSRSVYSFISALPQYLERYAARYANPLRDTNFSWNCKLYTRASGFGFVRSTKKEIGTHFGVPISFLVTRTGIEPMLQP